LDLGHGFWREEDGAVRHPVLPGPDELLPVLNQDVLLSCVRGHEERDLSPVLLSNGGDLPGQGLGHEQVGKLPILLGQDREDGKFLRMLGRIWRRFEHGGSLPSWLLGEKDGGGV